MAVEEKDAGAVLRAAATYADMIPGADHGTKMALTELVGKLIESVATSLNTGSQLLWFRCMLCGKSEAEMIRQGEGALCPGCHARVSAVNSGMSPW